MNTKSVLTPKEVKGLNSTELRVEASKLKIKNYAKLTKEQLQPLVIAAIKDAQKPVKEVSKSALLRAEIAKMHKKGLSIDSGTLMAKMKEKFNAVMHRSFIITVRNKFLQTLETQK